MKTCLKSSLKAGKTCIGSWITLAHPAIAEIMSRAGFDWLAVDLEHSVITIRETEELIRVIALSGTTPLVRLTSNDANLIKRVMDAGAKGVIVPMINSKSDVEKAVRALYYPPKGQRGVGLARAQGYGTSFQQYLKDSETQTVLVVQIEHEEAVNNLDEILSCPDVDAYMIGPYDLSASMGIPGQFNDPRFIKALEKIKLAGERHQKPGGLHVVEPDPEQLKQKVKDGHRFIAYSLDTRMLDVSCRTALQKLS